MSTQVLVVEDTYADAVLIRILTARSAVPIQITKLNWENKRQGNTVEKSIMVGLGQR